MNSEETYKQLNIFNIQIILKFLVNNYDMVVSN